MTWYGDTHHNRIVMNPALPHPPRPAVYLSLCVSHTDTAEISVGWQLHYIFQVQPVNMLDHILEYLKTGLSICI